jgi:hypothetical protein
MTIKGRNGTRSILLAMSAKSTNSRSESLKLKVNFQVYNLILNALTGWTPVPSQKLLLLIHICNDKILL